MSVNQNWEDIGMQCIRLRVPNGWLVRAIAGHQYVSTMGISITFVPDTFYEWKLTEEKSEDPK